MRTQRVAAIRFSYAFRLLACCSLGAFSAAAEWPQYRGPQHDGTSTDRINKQWIGSVTNAVWLAPLTNGLTSFAVGGGRAFTKVGAAFDSFGQAHKEFCVALDASNGGILWATEVDSRGTPQALNPRLYPDGGVGADDGPRTTPAVEGGSVYVLSSYLKLYRLNATNGAVIWSTNLIAGFGGSVIPWQNAASPLLENGLLFLNANCGNNTLMAFNATNGSLVWRSQNEAMTHSTPVLATIHGVRQVVFATQRGLVSLDPQTGTRLWQTNYPFGYTTSLAASPVVHSNIVFVSGYYTMGAAAFQISYTNATFVPSLLWQDRSLESHWSTPVCHNGFLYGQFTPDWYEAELRCIDLRTGEQKWAVSGFGRGAPALVDDHLLVITERGDLVLAQPDPAGYTEIARLLAIPNYHSDLNKCWNAIAIADGKVFVRSTGYGAMYDLSVPALKMDLPQPTAGSTLKLTIRSATGTGVDANRLTGVEVRTSTNAALSPSLWTKLTNALVLTNGVVQVTNVEASAPRRFFIVSEPD